MEETKMSIAGINGYNYSNYYTGTKRNTAKANGMNSGLLVECGCRVDVLAVRRTKTKHYLLAQPHTVVA